ncbi:outer membrane protein assembly factor BamC [Marinobacter sp. SS21]|uniref:outer membrane protein assembly factor BamC n=1 Tax=Marinobacter sp. SS21 TaxID=2979460 RepID=UPI00232DD32C|nr:outer membrane protein assembly factor BamC [Marinobacter sp. SS21]MDC0661971.1 outer membrane protein assembly factor BamC [Marinobacter sp. SS21]
MGAVPFRKIHQRGVLAGFAVSIALTAGLSGCGMLEDRSLRYVDAPEGEALDTVGERQRDRIGNAYPIREVEASKGGRMFADELPAPPDMTAEILEQNYLIEQLDDQVWLLINELPGQVWPGVTAYLSDRGFGVAHDSPQLGLVQTELANYSRNARALVGLEDGGQTEPKVLLQARVAPGVRRKTTEVQLRPRQVQGSPSELIPWQSTVERLEIERALLEDLSSFLQARVDTKSYSRAALGMASEPRVRMLSEAEQPVAIRMDLAFDRAWGEVKRALADAGVQVVDLDRSAGQFYVDFRSRSEKTSGWFDWFGDEPEPVYTFHVQLQVSDNAILVTAGRAPDHQGVDRSAMLLSRLFEYLY